MGYKENELINQNIEVIFAEKKDKLLFKEEGLGDLIKKGIITNMEMTFMSKEGRKIPVLFSASIMSDVDNKIQGVVCGSRYFKEQTG